MMRRIKRIFTRVFTLVSLQPKPEPHLRGLSIQYSTLVYRPRSISTSPGKKGKLEQPTEKKKNKQIGFMRLHMRAQHPRNFIFLELSDAFFIFTLVVIKKIDKNILGI